MVSRRHPVNILVIWFVLLDVSGCLVKGGFDDDTSSSSSSSEEKDTNQTYRYTTVILPTHKLRGVPEDVKLFWGDQYIYISIVTVIKNEICKKLNMKMEKLDYWINRTTEAVEKQVKIISNYEWKKRNESLPSYQKTVAEQLAKYWNKLVNQFEENKLEGVENQVQEMRKMFRDAQKDISERCSLLGKQVERSERNKLSR